MTTQPQFQISAPFTVTMQPDATGTLQVIDTGSQPITVHASLGRYSGHALMYPAADNATKTHTGAPWITIDGPASFTLQPGQAKVVHISSHVPAGTQGNHYIDLVWTASPVKAAAGPLHLTGGVATTVTLPMPGIAVPAGPDHLPRPVAAPGHGGIGTLDLAGIGMAVALVASVAGLVLRRRRRNRKSQVRAGRQEVSA